MVAAQVGGGVLPFAERLVGGGAEDERSGCQRRFVMAVHVVDTDQDRMGYRAITIGRVPAVGGSGDDECAVAEAKLGPVIADADMLGKAERTCQPFDSELHV